MADTTDKNLFAINDTLFPPNNTLVFPIFSNHNIINDTLVPPISQINNAVTTGCSFPVFAHFKKSLEPPMSIFPFIPKSGPLLRNSTPFV